MAGDDHHNEGDSSPGPSCSAENGYDAAACPDCPNSNAPSEGTYLKRGKQTYFDDEKVLIPEIHTVSILFYFLFVIYFEKFKILKDQM